MSCRTILLVPSDTPVYATRTIVSVTSAAGAAVNKSATGSEQSSAIADAPRDHSQQEPEVGHAPADVEGTREPARGALAGADSVAPDVYPWETPPEVWEKLDEYTQRGLAQQYPCECNQTVRRITAMDVRARGVKAALHVFPDAIAMAIPTAPEGADLPLWLALPLLAVAFLMRAVEFLISIPLLIILMPFVCARVVFLLFVVGVVCLVLYDALSNVVGGGLGLVLTLILVGILAALLIGIRFMGHRWKWLGDFAAKLIRRNPLRGYAIALLNWYTPLLPRCWQRGDVVQLVRCEAKTGLFSGKSLLAFVQDRPLRRRPGLLDVLLLPLNPRRRIHFVSFRGGEDSAEAAAKAAGQALGLEVDRAFFHKRKGVRLV